MANSVESLSTELMELDEESLTTKLGLLDRDAKFNLNATSIDYLTDMPQPRGGLDDLLKAGQNILTSVSPVAYQMLCSEVGLGKDSELAQELTKLMAQKTTEASVRAASLLVPILASAGLPQSLAVVAGTLLVKKLAKGSSDLICTTWKQSIDRTLAVTG